MKHKIVMRNLFTPRAELLIRLEEARDKRKEARNERELSAKNARIEHERRKANAWLKEVSSEFTGEEYSQEEAKEVFKGCMLLVRRFEKYLHETATYTETVRNLLCPAATIIIAPIAGIYAFQRVTVEDAPVPLRILTSIVFALIISSAAISLVAMFLGLLNKLEKSFLPEELSRQYRLNLNYWKFVSRAVSVAETYHLDVESLGCSKSQFHTIKTGLEGQLRDRTP